MRKKFCFYERGAHFFYTMAQLLYNNRKQMSMPDKEHPGAMPDMPVPDKQPEINPAITPDIPEIPHDTPEIIPEERPAENPIPEIPLPPGTN